MSLPSRDYYLQLEGNKFLSIKRGEITLVKDMAKGFNFHSHDQAEAFIDYLKNNHFKSSIAEDLKVYRY